MYKVLILANNDIGLYNFRKELIEELIAQKNRVYLSLPDGPKIQALVTMGAEFIDTPVNRRGINPITDIKLLIKYFQIIKMVKPDYIFSYTIKPNIYGGISSRIKKVPLLATITGLGTVFQKDGLLKDFIIFLYRQALKSARSVLFENVSNLNTFVENSIITSKQAVLLNGAGVNIEQFNFDQLPKQNGVSFIFLGRIMKEKGVDELFAVAQRIVREYPDTQFHVLGYYEENYKDTVEKLHEQGVINFHGMQEDVKPYIQASHCCILPSYHEGMSNTLLEAASMGRPLITSNINGCKEAVIDGESGYLCNVRDGEDLYLKVKQFIELPYEKKAQMGVISRKHIENNFNRERVVEKVISLLD